jgi:high affinity Mn2+ porin
MYKKVCVLGRVVLFALAMSDTALAADGPASMPFKAPTIEPYYNWTGFYLGGHIGVATGSSDWFATQGGAVNPSLSGSLNFPGKFNFMAGTGSYYSGLQAGYNYVLPSRLMLGFEVDVSFPNSDVVVPNSIAGSQTFSSLSNGQASYSDLVEYLGTVRGRIGYAFDNFLIYGTGGLAWMYDQLARTQIAGTPVGGSAAPGTIETALLWRFGWAIGGGIEVPLTPSWTARAEYLLTDFGRNSVTFPAAAQRFDSNLALQSIRLGLNYRIGDDFGKSELITKGPTALDTDRFSFHGQVTYVNQYAFPFRDPYHGTNSLDSNAGRETADITFYAGARLWEGAEFWINPEIDQGFGLSGTVGAAGFPSAEAYKVGSSNPYTRLHRAFIRQTIDLGGEAQKIESGLNQFAGSQTADRLVFTVGKFGVTDVFDMNKYAHDPRNDFLNWTIADTGTFDYAADAWAYTVGAAVEWYIGSWTLRGGVFDLSIAPNSTALDPTFDQFQWIGEIERRYELWGRPGKVAVTGFLSRGRMGRFDDAIQLAQLTGSPADIAAVRHYTSRGGISVNMEQQVVPDVGVFARAGFADGNVEPYEFTDVDRTIAAGLSVSGNRWGMPDHTFGLAGVVNGISGSHEAFLNAGGLGILVGDGMLPNPGAEKIIETYYSFPILSWRATLDYQFIANPAYNRDRGPVSVIGTRLHSQF